MRGWQTDRLLDVIKEHPGMKFVVCHLLAVSMRTRDKLVEGLKKLALPNVVLIWLPCPITAALTPTPIPMRWEVI